MVQDAACLPLEGCYIRTTVVNPWPPVTLEALSECEVWFVKYFGPKSVSV